MSDDFISSDRGLAGVDRELLRAFAGTAIPANGEYGVPGADDATIAADIVASASGSAAEVAAGLAALDALSRDRSGESGESGGGFVTLDPDERLAVAETFRSARRELAAPLIALVAQCYYRDERVMAALGMEPRPPYPEGFELEQGDWSLLDPVRRRAPMYR